MQRSVLVTGAASGFGRRIVLRLARAGWRVFATLRRAEERGPALREEAGDAADRLEILELDVTSDDQVREVFAEVVARTDRLHALVNNAGYALAGAVEDVHLDEYREQMDTNLFGCIRTIQAAIPHMRERGGGWVVTIGSNSGRVTVPFLSPYSASKKALTAITDALHYEVAEFGIRVTLIEPGSFATAIWDREAMAEGSRREASPYAARLHPLIAEVVDRGRRSGDPERVVDAVLDVLGRDRPPARLLVGRDARIMALAQRLGGPIFPSWFTARFMRLPGLPSGPPDGR